MDNNIVIGNFEIYITFAIITFILCLMITKFSIQIVQPNMAPLDFGVNTRVLC